MKKYIIYFIGVMLIALGISLSSLHGLGASPYDTVTLNISLITNIQAGIIIFIFNALFLILYFIKFKNKDIYMSIIVLFTLSFFVDGFIYLLTWKVFNIDFSQMWLRIVLFVIGFLSNALGVSLIENTKVSKSALECFVTFMNHTLLKKVSYSTSRIIVEVSFTIVGGVVGLIFLKSLSNVNIGTIIYMIASGPMIGIFMKLLPDFSKKKS